MAVQGWESIKLDIRVEFFGERSEEVLIFDDMWYDRVKKIVR